MSAPLPNKLKGSKNLLAILDNRNGKKKYTECFEGSMRSGKTFAILQCMALEAARNTGYVGRVFRRDATVSKRTLFTDLKTILMTQLPELWDAKCWNKQDAVYTFPVNGENAAKIYFAGTNDPEVLKGLTQTDALLNEATEHSLEAKRQIEGRTKRYKTYDWNPSFTDHWIFTDILKQNTDDYFYAHSTFRDNPYIYMPFAETNEIPRSIEKWEPTPENIKAGTASDWHWQVYGLGLRAQRPGAIYTNWEIVDEWPDKMACTRWGYALDFGFSIDPTALVECAYFQDKLYLRECVYDIGLINLERPGEPDVDSLEGRLKDLAISKKDLIVADSAHPDLIEELRIAGYNVHGVKKISGEKKGYVLSSINRLQQQRIKVHRSANNIIKELQNYIWKTDIRTGIQRDEPIGDFNHALDAVRGFVYQQLKPRRIPEKNTRPYIPQRPQSPLYNIRRDNRKVKPTLEELFYS